MVLVGHLLYASHPTPPPLHANRACPTARITLAPLQPAPPSPDALKGPVHLGGLHLPLDDVEDREVLGSGAGSVLGHARDHDVFVVQEAPGVRAR